MRVLVAFDKFKDSLRAPEACTITADALRTRHPDWSIDLCPLTDGGEGFCEILTRAAGGTFESFAVTGPRGEQVEAPVGFVSLGKIPAHARAFLAGKNRDSEISRDDSLNRIAIIEMAAASGLALLPENKRDPWLTTSLGTGQLIRHAATRGASVVLLGLGGSATHDLGFGALESLGLKFLAGDGSPVTPPIPAHWHKIAAIGGEIRPALPPLRIACDVTNPLLGPRGAAAAFAPQKGLHSDDFLRLEGETARLASLLCARCSQPDSLVEIPGTGAAGGAAFGLMAAAGAQLLSGFDLVSHWLDLDARLGAADIVLTGEGRFDESSLHGKAPGAIVARALALGKPVHVFAGSCGEFPGGGPRAILHGINPPGASLTNVLRVAPARLAAAVHTAF